SPYYLRPGFAFGGSCLPKEVRAVAHLAEERDLDLPLVQSLMPTNNAHIAQAEALLADFAGKRIGFLGVTFKPGTDDLRESPTLELMSRLQAKGEALKAYDPNLEFGPGLQSQISYVRHACPTQAALMDELEGLCVDSIDALMADSDVVVVSHATEEFRAAVRARAPRVHILDLARLFKEVPDDASYAGIAW
ncbi:MAG: UDP binding domain-containing protein, partial [Pseudomonadota bacterium]